MDILRGARFFQDTLGWLYSLTILALALLGMGGIAYHALAPGGLIETRLQPLWDAHPVFLCIVLIGLTTMVLATPTPLPIARRRSVRRRDTALYALVALGTFFAARLIVSGAL
jgi:hypothetical protein